MGGRVERADYNYSAISQLLTKCFSESMRQVTGTDGAVDQIRYRI